MNATVAIHFSIVPRDELAPDHREAMFCLMSRYFEGVTEDQFARDLAEKSVVILLLAGEQLVGFSTLLALTTSFQGKAIDVVYSGDTIVAPEAWGTTALPRGWVRAVEETRTTLSGARCFWLLLTSGYRTYRFLPVFWREFYPRFDRPTPAEHQHLLNHVATERFGAQYDLQRGIVRFRQPQRLFRALSRIPDARMKDPHVAFFASRNPGHIRGDELVCLTEICPNNLTRAGRRMMVPQPCAI